jgi:hypothetical protein
MPDAFDPYYVWLGIGPEEQPANHYRLLGIRQFETNADVIDNAADRQTAHLRTLQSGQNGKLTQRLLNEVAAARICLLNPQSKAAYDQKLRIMMAGGAPAGAGSAIGRAAVQPPSASAIGRGATAPPPQLPPNSAIGRRTMPQPAAPTQPGSAIGSRVAPPGGSQIGGKAAAPLQVAQSLPNAAPLPAPNPQTNWDSLIGDEDKAPARKSKSGKLTTRKQPGGRVWAAAVAIGLIAAAGLAFIIMRGPSEGVLTFDWPAADRAGATLTIDGQQQGIPESGPWEFRGPLGAHQIVAQRPSLKYEATVTLAAGEPQPVVPDWKPKAELSLTWPLAERAGATLTIDGHPQPPSQREPLVLPVEPGHHVIHAARPESQPFDLTVTVAADERRNIAVVVRAEPLLAISLPVDQRRETTLTIDGQSVAMDPSVAILQYRLKPGQHSLRIERPGFQPFEQEVTLDAADNKSVAPVWTPLVAGATPQNTDRPENSDTASTKTPAGDNSADNPLPAVKKLSVPSPAEQEKIAKDLDSIYKVTHVSAKDKALAEEMLKTADEPGSTPSERYMLLMKAASLAADLGEFDGAFQAIDTIDAAYDIDPLAAKQMVLDDAVKTATGTNPLIALVAAALTVIDQAIAADQFDAAMATIAIAKKAIAKRPADARLHKDADERLTHLKREIAALQAAYAGVDEAQKTLAKKSDDPAGNLAVGRWYCLLKNDWPRGLPLLAKSGDERFQPLAKQELAGNLDTKTQLQIADGWWDAAAKETDLAGDNARLHASEIYRTVLPNLESPLKKIAIEQRLVEVATIKPHESQGAGTADVPPYSVNRYSWNLGQPNKRLIPKNRGFCFLAAVSGHFAGYGEAAGVHLTSDGFWSLDGHSGQDALSAEAVSIESLTPAVFKSGPKEYHWRNGQPPVKMLHKNVGICFLSAIEGHFEGSAESVSVRLADDGYWYLEGKSNQDQLGASAVGIEWAKPGAYSIEAQEHNWSVGDSPVRLLEKRQGFAFLSSVSGRFLGQGEDVRVYLGDDDVWHLAGRSGQSSLRATGTSIRVTRAAGSYATTSERSHPDKSTGFPLNQWVDLLRLSSPTADAVYGKWTRQSTEIVCEPADYARLRFPIEVTGSYDLEVEFTRKVGNDDVNAIIPVGGHRFMVMLGAIDGSASGLSRIDGVSVRDQKQYAVHPGKLENGRRCRMLISVRVLKDGTAAIDVSIQGKQIWPQWKGPLTALVNLPGWELPSPREIGLGAWDSRVTFHSVRVRVLSGDASSAPTMTEPPPTIAIVAARWGGGNKADVTQRVREAVRNGEWVWATPDFLHSDPDPGWRKGLDITFDKSGKRQSAGVGEGGAWKIEEQLGK